MIVKMTSSSATTKNPPPSSAVIIWKPPSKTMTSFVNDPYWKILKFGKVMGKLVSFLHAARNFAPRLRAVTTSFCILMLRRPRRTHRAPTTMVLCNFRNFQRPYLAPGGLELWKPQKSWPTGRGPYYVYSTAEVAFTWRQRPRGFQNADGCWQRGRGLNLADVSKNT